MSSPTSLQHLETTLPKDRGYARAAATPFPEALGGFVCPRANVSGGREGIIPPAVAAVRGLVPKGLRHVTNADVARTAAAAAQDPRSDADRYRAYYGNGPSAALRQEQEDRDLRETEALLRSRAAAGGQVERLVRTVTVTPPIPGLLPAPSAETGDAAPAVTPAPQPPQPQSSRGGRDRKGRFAKGVVRNANTPKIQTNKPKQASKDVFGGASGLPDDDTLDGFYDSLASAGVRTSSVVRPRLEGAEIAVDADEDGLRGETLRLDAAGSDGLRLRRVTVTPDTPAVTEPDVRQELETLRQALGRAHEALVLAREENASRTAETAAVIEERDALARQLKESAPVPQEQVRVVLGRPEEKLRIGGDRWDVKLKGALHWSRSALTLVLTVSDPAYAAELLSELKPGPVVILSSERRSSCVYAGNCAKIYGESEEGDYVGVFRFAVDASVPVSET